MDHRVAVERKEEAPRLPTILAPNQQLELQRREEDWTGLTDPSQRRKLQNRLHQRAWRRRQARERKSSSTNSRCKDGSATQEPHLQDQGFTTTDISSEPAIQPTQICFLKIGNAQQTLTQFERHAYQQYLQGAPRIDLLLTLVQFNIVRALEHNSHAIGIGQDWLEESALSPFNMVERFSPLETSSRPEHLRPSFLQRHVEHHPWIDLLPIPQMRDNILRAGESFDDAPLCYDILEFFNSPSGQPGLIVWGDPSHTCNWEVSEQFLKTWAWTIQGCWELFNATNYWRRERGERKLFPDALCFPQLIEHAEHIEHS